MEGQSVWFFFRSDPSISVNGKLEENIGCAIHVSASDEYLKTMTHFRDFVNCSLEGRRLYREIKLEAYRSSVTRTEYKEKKSKRIGEVIEKAEKWS
jgi:hypothetical protein